MPKAAKVAIGVVAAVVVVFSVGSYAIDRQMLGQTYARHVAQNPSFLLTNADVAANYPSEAVEFQLDGKTLRGRVYRAKDERGLIVFRHGIFSHSQDYLALVTALVDKGWSVFTYDAIGCGESDGDSVLGFAQSPLDVRAAVRFANESGLAHGLPLVLLGHSWGGYGVAGALDFEDVRNAVSACVTMSGFDTPNDIIFESAEKSAGPISVTQHPFISLIGLLDFGADANRSASCAVNECGLPVLVIHGTGDEVISFKGSSIIAERDNIKNPLVSYSVKDEEGRNGHNSYFYSPESQAYLNECAERLSALQAEYGGNAPDDALSSFMSTIDKQRANVADPALIEEIDTFYARAINGTK